MKKIVIILLSIFLGIPLFICAISFFTLLLGGMKEPSPEGIKTMVIKNESARIPLYMQEFENVFDIQIDSMVLTNYDEGYLVTTWDLNERQDNLSLHEQYRRGYKDKYIRKTKIGYVPVKRDLSGDGWDADWESTYRKINHSNQE